MRFTGSIFDDQIADNGSVNLTGGTLDVGGRNEAINQLSGTGVVTSTVGLPAQLRVGGAGGSSAYAGSMTDGPTGLQLYKEGAGSLLLTGTLTHRSTEVIGGTLELTNQAHSDMTVRAAGTLRVQPGGNNAVHLAGFTSMDPGGRMDVTSNGLVFSPGAEDTVRGWLVQGYNSGSWNGSGINSSTAAGSGLLDSVGYGLAAQVFGISGGQTAIFRGKTVGPNETVVRYTLAGDADLDGDVDVGDLGRLASAWQTTGKWTTGDFDYNGTVDVGDLGLLASNWQASVAASLTPTSLTLAEALAAFGLPAANVPEPAALSLLAPIAPLFSRYRRNA